MNADELRQLDREMAAIMGWHQVGALVGGETEPRLAWEAGRIPQMPLCQWHPTEDIRQAMMVARELVRQGWMCDVHLRGKYTEVVLANAVRGCCYSSEVTGDNAALAICLAAKAAKGEAHHG